MPPVRKLARDLGLVYLKGHDRFDSLGGPSAPWPADGLACTDGRRAQQGSGGPGSADSAEAGSSSRAGAAADGGRRRPRGCGQAARRARADSLEMEEAFPARKSRRTTFGCLSFAKTRSRPTGIANRCKASLDRRLLANPAAALVCGEQVHRAGRARWMRGRAVPRRTKTAPGWGEVRRRGVRTGGASRRPLAGRLPRRCRAT